MTNNIIWSSKRIKQLFRYLEALWSVKCGVCLFQNKRRAVLVESKFSHKKWISTSHDSLNDLNIQMGKSVLFRENGIEHSPQESINWACSRCVSSFKVFRFTSERNRLHNILVPKFWRCRAWPYWIAVENIKFRRFKSPTMTLSTCTGISRVLLSAEQASCAAAIAVKSAAFGFW